MFLTICTVMCESGRDLGKPNRKGWATNERVQIIESIRETYMKTQNRNDLSQLSGTVKPPMSWSWVGACGLAALLLVWTTTAVGQVPPTLTIADASVAEGNAGTTSLVLTLVLSAPTNQIVAGSFSAIPMTGTGFSPATGGSACGAPGVDFVQVNNLPVSIPANTLSKTVTITVCGDSIRESNEQIFFSVTNVTRAQCFEGTCNGIATILDDGDTGISSISIADATIKQPSVGTRTLSFVLSLSAVTTQDVRVDFSTENGGAIGGSSCGLVATGTPDFVTKSGTITIPAGQTSGLIDITICAGTLRESDEAFKVILGPRISNASIKDGAAIGGIRAK